MKNYTAEDIKAALKEAGFSKVKADHHKNKPWLTVIARKQNNGPGQKEIEYWFAESETKDRKWDIEYVKKHFPGLFSDPDV